MQNNNGIDMAVLYYLVYTIFNAVIVMSPHKNRGQWGKTSKYIKLFISQLQEELFDLQINLVSHLCNFLVSFI